HAAAQPSGPPGHGGEDVGGANEEHQAVRGRGDGQGQALVDGNWSGHVPTPPVGPKASPRRPRGALTQVIRIAIGSAGAAAEGPARHLPGPSPALVAAAPPAKPTGRQETHHSKRRQTSRRPRLRPANLKKDPRPSAQTRVKKPPPCTQRPTKSGAAFAAAPWGIGACVAQRADSVAPSTWGWACLGAIQRRSTNQASASAPTLKIVSPGTRIHTSRSTIGCCMN